MLVWSVFHLPKFLLLSLVFAYIDISQGSVKMHLPCGEIYNNHIIANCLQRAPMKEFWKLANDWWRYWQKRKVPRYFMAHSVHTEKLSSNNWLGPAERSADQVVSSVKLQVYGDAGYHQPVAPLNPAQFANNNKRLPIITPTLTQHSQTLSLFVQLSMLIHLIY